MSTSALVDALIRAEAAVLERFGYRHDWRIYPVVDRRDRWWWLEGENPGDEIVTAENEAHLREVVGLSGEHPDTDDLPPHANERVFRDRHHDRSVWRADDCTLVHVLPSYDHNCWLAIYANEREVREG